MLAFTRRQNTKNHSLTRKVRRGGKYMGEGTYGCGFAPALRCEGETVRKFGIFSKLMDTAESEKELRKATLLKTVDPAQDYILYALNVCKLNQSLIGPDNPENNIDSCQKNFVPNHLDQARVVQYLNGGLNLRKLNKTASVIADLFLGMDNLFRGLFHLQQANVSHNDIKDENIVAKQVENGNYQVRFIDVGFVHKNDQPIPGDLPFEADYYVWPIEMKLTVFKRISKEDIKKWYDTHTYGAKDAFFTKSNAKKLTFASANKLTEALTEKAKKKVPAPILNASLTATAKLKLEQEYEKQWKKIRTEMILKKSDVFSLGTFFSIFYENTIYHKMEHGEILVQVVVEKAGKIADEYVKLDNLETTRVYTGTVVGKEASDWHREVAEKISKPFYKLCISMMNLDPFKRPELPIALAQYKKLHPHIEKYFKADKLLTYVDGICVKKKELENEFSKVSP